MIKHIKDILTGKRSIKDVYHYLLGNYRYKLYYNKVLSRFLRSHIFEQIKYRIEWMDSTCYHNGSCKLCGCMTTQLQMANKKCEGDCYPPMMNKGEWEYYKAGGFIKDSSGNFYWLRNPMLSKPEKVTGNVIA